MCSSDLVLFGLLIPFFTGWWGQGWVHTKITLAVILAGYHFYCYRLLIDFQERRNRYSHRWFRVFNEIPVLVMAAALYLVVYKPF